MKLELKHLAPYLPYGLKFIVEISEFAKKELGNTAPYENRVLTLRNDVSLCLKHGKPILRPLSDLTEKEWQEIADLLKDDFSGDLIKTHVHFHKDHEAIPYWIMKELLKRHIDVFNLIQKGLAIDINTLK